jgi:transitional endoplasmic reticulum ATPase
MRRRVYRLSQPSLALDDSPFAATLADYAHNILVGTPLRRLRPQQIEAMADSQLLNRLARAGDANSEQNADEDDDGNNARERFITGLRKHLERFGREPRLPRAPLGEFEKNLRWLAGVVGLDGPQRAVLQFALIQDLTSDLSDLTELFGAMDWAGMARVVAAAIALPEEQVRAALSPSARLVQSRLLSISNKVDDLDSKLRPWWRLKDALTSPDLDDEKLLARTLRPVRERLVEWEDVQHLEARARVARDILAGALRSQARGVNILLHGATGSGKTALACLLAHDLAVDLYTVDGEGEGGATSPDADDRLSALVVGGCLLSNERSLLLFDEMEDIFEWNWHGVLGEVPRGTIEVSKRWFNDLLESNPVPTLWITNRIEGIDPAFLRRFMYTMEFRPLGVRQRARVLARHLDAGFGSAVVAHDIDALASDYPLAPAQLATAVHAARLIALDGRPERGSLEAVLEPARKLCRGERATPRASADNYDIEVLNASVNLPELVDSLAANPQANHGLSICLYGPPGTGKTAFIRALARRIDRRLVERRPSDIFGPFVGETERSIAEAFQEAHDSDAILLFDEVDTILRDRSGALRSWEVSAINEFLLQLETQRCIVACTTNLWHAIDQAALRRFTLKVELRYLRAEQALRLFERMFASTIEAATPEQRDAMGRELARCATLTPGDFATVANRLRVLGREVALPRLLELVLDETRHKAVVRGPIGFE